MFLKLPILVALFFTDELWGQNLAWLHGISDIAIALTYYFISLLLIYVIHRREDIPFTSFLWLLTFFFISCGTTYVISLGNIWQPHYWLWGYGKGFTAIIALITALRILFVIPQVLNFPSSQQLQDINEGLNQEITQFQLLEHKIRSSNAQLEQKISERTAELEQLNQQLTTEIEERKQIESALHRQIQLEQLIGYLSHRFINVTAPELDSTIDEALNSISEFVGADRSYLFLFAKQNSEFQVTQKWSMTVPELPDLSDWDREIESKLPWIMTNIKSNVIVNLPQIDSLPPEADCDRSYLTTHQIKSLLIVPMFYGTALKGILALEAVNQSEITAETRGVQGLEPSSSHSQERRSQGGKPRDVPSLRSGTPHASSSSAAYSDRWSKSWTERDIQLLKLTGEIISGAIERCRQAAELTNRTQQLEASNTELEQFAYIVSHDLLEPLRSISGFSYLLQEEYQSQLNQEAQEYLDFINDGAARMKQLIEDLLAFSRVGSQNLVLTLIDCEQIIREVISNLQAAITENNVQIHWDNLPKVIGDRTLLIQLWQNLISNAIKFRNPKSVPQIYIAATQKSHELIFSIRDNGIGIDPQYTEDIFAVFRRLHTRQQYPGTGIGLAICRRIAELHGGKIWVKSSLGKGSTFYVSLPIHNQKELGNEYDN